MALDTTLIDWYAKNETVLYQYASMFPMTAIALESMRRIGGYVPRVYVVPDPSLYPSTLGSAILYDVKMKQGGIIYALNFYCASPINFYLQIRQQDGTMLFAEPTNIGLITNSMGEGAPIYLLSAPYVIGTPTGTVSVELYNGAATIDAALSPQLLIFVAEPSDDTVKECTTTFDMLGNLVS